jgi:energy-coupling factor transporter ATP-binding protein EcfA2
MVRGRSFYAIWDDELGLWSTDEYDVQRLVDEDLRRYADKQAAQGSAYTVKDLRSFSTNGWNQFRRFIQNISDNSHQLDENLTFANSQVKKSDYVSRRLPYSLDAGDYSGWDELVGTLYSVEERAKIEWVIGAIVAGDAKKIQKFLVLYGPAGTGKSTILNIVEKLFVGYTTSFEAKALGSTGNAFATEAFKHNPLVALQHDGDLSKIEDNTKLNSIIAHEDMTMNEKYKPSYTSRVNAFLLMGTNQPVKISDAKSGIIRRLIDVHPTGVKIPVNHYHSLMAKIDFELGAIALHCLETYREMGKNYYNGYKPLEMMLQTDIFFNYIEANYDIFKEQDSTTLKQAYGMLRTI